MSPKHEKAEIRRGQILDAASKVWAEKGYHAARIDDIVALSRLSKGAIYHHFTSKLDIFGAVAEQMMDEMVMIVNAAAAEGKSVNATLDGLARISEAMVSSKGILHSFFDFYVLSLREESLRSRLRVRYEAMIKAVQSLFQRGADTGELRPNAPDAAIAFLTTLDGIFLVSPLFDDPAFIPREMRAWVELALEGLRARP